MSWISTSQGIKMDLANPRPEMVNVNDIVHHLSMQCRWVGATTQFYSVAQHCSIGACAISDRTLALKFLLHDANETYLGDPSRPLKKMIPELKAIADKVQAVVWEHFGLPISDADEEVLKYWDDRMLATERRDLVKQRDWHDWDEVGEPLEKEITFLWDPEYAKVEFATLMNTLLPHTS